MMFLETLIGCEFTAIIFLESDIFINISLVLIANWKSEVRKVV